MTEQEIKSLTFRLKEQDEPISIDFFHLDLNVLGDITRILDIEGYKSVLEIEVDADLYRQIGELIFSNHWMLNFGSPVEPGMYDISLNGFKIIFKRKM